jgi:uncharacterized damage-inducible protein DinB
MSTLQPSAFKTLSWYNRQVNGAVAELLRDYRALVLEPKTTYYGSILDLLSHIAHSDRSWLERLEAQALVGSRMPQPHSNSGSGAQFTDFEAWRSHRDSLDRFMESYCVALTETELAREVTYRNTKGVEYCQPLWQLLLHMFNHETHHRGQIAQVLDERGVANDYSNLVWYLRA